MTSSSTTKILGISFASFVATLLLGLFVVLQQSTISGLRDKVALLETAVQNQQSEVDRTAVAELVGGYLNHPYNVAKTLCAPPATGCELVTAVDSPLGSHEPLWLSYDGLRQLELANMPFEVRGKLSGLYLDLMFALNQRGVLEQVMSTDRSPEGFVTSLYRATVAQALVCQRFATADCRNGLPKPVTRSLRELMAYVAETGPRIAPYESSKRSAAVSQVTNVLR